LDRVGRRAADVLNLLKGSKVEVAFADAPNSRQLQIGILAVVAEEETRAISSRTRVMLAAAKARGTKLGNLNGALALALYRTSYGARQLSWVRSDALMSLRRAPARSLSL
jgi:DNA invertase Pin-like site-specific DNA recombinase